MDWTVGTFKHRLASICLIATAIVLLSASPSSADERLRFDDSTRLSVAIKSDGTGTTTIVLLNDGPSVDVNLSFAPTGDKATSISISPETASLDAFGATPVKLTMSGVSTDDAVAGDLVASGDKVGVAVRGMSLAVAPSKPNYVERLGFGSLALAVFFIVVRLIFLQRTPATKFGFTSRLGPGGWKFSDSWASNLTAVGVLLGTVVAASVLPENPHLLTKTQYGALNLYFGMLVVVAAFLYNALVAKKEVPGDATKKPIPPATYLTEGFVWSYLLASLLTLWAVWGEVGTLYVMMTDTLGKGQFSSLPGVLLLAGSGIVVVAGGLYAWLTIGWNVQYYKDTPPSITLGTPTEEPVPVPVHRVSVL